MFSFPINLSAASSKRAFLAYLLLLACSCGEPSFTDGGTGSPPVPQQDPPPAPLTPHDADSVATSVGWLWSCDSVTGKEGENTGKVKLRGAGKYQINAPTSGFIPVKFSGAVCTPQQAPRDIIFAVDVSGSMNGNDPIIGSSCGRLDAVNAMLSAIPKGTDVRFGIVTFSSGVVAKSSKLQPTTTALFQDVMTSVNAVSVVNVLCATGSGTNYQAGLTAGQALFTAGSRSNASKELIFVSDGEPDSDKLSGKEVAAALRASGVTIGTVMLNGGNAKDQVMEADIASKDSSGAPLHTVVTQSSQLAQAFAKVSKNELVSAELRYRVVGTKDFTVINLLTSSSNLKFDLEPITIAVEDAQNGLEVVYDYSDSRSKHYTSQGVMTWVQTP